jgi:hypothetical protein
VLKNKNPGPEEQALVIAGGSLLYWKFIDTLKSQISNSKYQTISHTVRFWSRAAQALAPRVEYWNLRFICNLVLGICDFKHKTPRCFSPEQLSA